MSFIKALSVILFVLGLFKIATGYERHGYVGDKLMKAWHITLPGYAEVYYPEHTINLKDWAGTRYRSLEAIDKDTGQKSAEATAGIALKTTGIYLDYKLKQGKDGHWILWRPASSKKYFTWTAYYRIAPWRAAD